MYVRVCVFVCLVMVQAAHVRDLVLRLLQQNMALADKLKKRFDHALTHRHKHTHTHKHTRTHAQTHSLQRRRALELALEVEVLDKDEALLHASAVKEVCIL